VSEEPKKAHGSQVLERHLGTRKTLRQRLKSVLPTLERFAN
jgi:hypothetical protein